MGILLSLASQGLEHPPAALLAVGRDPAGQVLLGRGARLADRGLCVSSAADLARLQAAPALPRHSAGAPAAASAWLNAGPLVMARGGVCLIGCWDKWSRSAAASAAGITAALESGKVVLECRDLLGTQLPSAGPSVPLQCAVWAYWSPASSARASDLRTLRTLLNTFGVPVLADVGSDEEVEDICDHLLSKATGEQILPNVVLDKDMKEFLTLVNAQPVTLTDEASRLIQDYFVASRRVRPNCLPVTAISTIAAMAEALARISLRVEATWADVVLVVWMYEVALTNLFGSCLVSPLPDICGVPFEAEYLSYQMDCRLNSIKVWLENFVKSILLSSLLVDIEDN
ncbi:Minichromosome maintenance domain-containing protein 2 [Frankliniella fusca]|uniref:Minichromosome maintenance domain-containing protein 2 n=1 Tax=Frankliniella fusca TaxID=407009 RepID=A0AAE1LQA7_9NEOP|nr:Minichromosome maintenance domain-containing protein 2 [Frankliniella fusca]